MKEKFPLSVVGSAAEETGFLDLQLFVSTGTLVLTSFQFCGETSPIESAHFLPKMSEGVYYLLEGELRPVVEGAPPGFVPFSEESGLLRPQHR